MRTLKSPSPDTPAWMANVERDRRRPAWGPSITPELDDDERVLFQCYTSLYLSPYLAPVGKLTLTTTDLYFRDRSLDLAKITRVDVLSIWNAVGPGRLVIHAGHERLTFKLFHTARRAEEIHAAADKRRRRAQEAVNSVERDE